MGLEDLKKPQIARLMERVGIERISGLAYEESRGILGNFLQYFLKKVVIYTEYYKKQTVSVDHVMMAMKSPLFLIQKNIPTCSSKDRKAATCLVFQKAPFQRLIRETANKYKQDLSFEQEALQLIQYYTEMYMTNLYTEARYILIAAKRETLEPRDLQMARSITGDAKKIHA